MIFKLLLVWSVTTALSVEPAWLAAASGKYQACVYAAIDRQYESGHFSENAALHECASVRRAQMNVARFAAAKETDAKSARKDIVRKFAQIDGSVRTIIGHLRARRGR